MILSAKIADQLRNAKIYGKDLLEAIIEEEKNGNEVTNQRIKFIVLHRLIDALRRYYEANYDDEGNTLDEPLYECLTDAYFNKLMSQLKIITNAANYPVGNWVLDENSNYTDQGQWRDEALWSDF